MANATKRQQNSPQPDSPERPDEKKREPFVPSEERSGRKVRATFNISAELLNELRDVAVALSGPPDRLTLSDLAEGAFGREVARLKRVHMRGKAFAKRASELKGGRPIR